ncbi:TPA: aldehyde ferredoxin oxidoreductase [Candidatus Poribacteria bacterium]|nr:aldehyde ferredoxin oxidoreductase [Candidatus Poribacteria bacterium]
MAIERRKRMAGGYMGNGSAKILFVDLSNGEIKEELFGEEILRKYIGGYGLAAKIMYDRQKPGVDPLGPENMLGFLTGPLTGTPAVIGSRYVVVGKSPLTGTWGDANSGGEFGPNLKFSGYDGVFFTGISKKPVYLFIENGKAELKDADWLWGKDTNETEDLLKEKHGKKTNVACIGPSGEKLSLISCVINDKGRAAGRSGLGAVMGSKKLKALAVLGDMKVPLADEQRTMALRRAYINTISGFGDVLKKYGTAGITAGASESGDAPVKNWSDAGSEVFPTATKISDDAVIAYQEKRYACWRCPIGCGGHVKVVSGPFASTTHKPEYETLGSYGTMCLNDNIESIIKLNEICNKMGLDTISAGCTIAFAIECYENGIITKEDTDGIELKWGNAEAIVAMTEKLAKREGFGDILADGAKIAADKIGKGAGQYAVHVAGQEVPMHDPKFTHGLTVTYLIDATPARHTQGGELITPGSGMDLTKPEPRVYTGRAKLQRELMNLMHIVNVAGLCMFGYSSMPVDSLPEFMSSVTGWDYSLDECQITGERIGTLRHVFNLREGHNPLEREFSGRIIGRPPLTRGPLKDVSIDKETMIKEYLELVDWDQKTAVPSKSALSRLGLDFVIGDLYK